MSVGIMGVMEVDVVAKNLKTVLEDAGGDPPRGYWFPQSISKISCGGKMDWGQTSALFGLACFGAIVFFMVYRKPPA